MKSNIEVKEKMKMKTSILTENELSLSGILINKSGNVIGEVRKFILQILNYRINSPSLLNLTPLTIKKMKKTIEKMKKLMLLSRVNKLWES